MKRRQIPEGYMSTISAHNNPAQAQPPPPIIERKEAETLMGHCLKQFIRERLYGNIVNYNRNYNYKKSLFTPSISNLHSQNQVERISDGKVLSIQTNKDTEKLRQNLKHKSSNRYNSLAQNINKAVNESEGINRHRKSLSSIQQSVILQRKRNSINRSALNKKSSFNQKNKSLDHDVQRYKGMSFLSAIEQDDHKPSKQIPRKQKKLSPLVHNNELMQRLEKLKVNKKVNNNRVQNDKLIINMNIWQLFCQKSKNKNGEIQQAQLTTILTNQPSLIQNQSFTTNIAKSMVTARSIITVKNSTFEKPKFIIPKTSFSKEIFMDYISNKNFIVPNLSQLCYNFFQLSGGKLFDQMKMEDYKQVMDNLVTASPRVWSILAFRFWDTDQNGLICSNDIFQMYKYLDEIKNQFMSLDTNQPYRSMNLVKKLLESLQILRSTILQLKLDSNIAGKSQQSKLQDLKMQIKYLQEAILRKKDLKYSDLLLILGHNIKISNKQHKHSIIQSVKELGIKFSSCYRYSFLATDHNEQTRQNRQHIQNLKQSLKRQKISLVQQQQDLINKKFPGISYTTFVEKQLYKSIKETVLDMFGLQVIDTK